MQLESFYFVNEWLVLAGLIVVLEGSTVLGLALAHRRLLEERALARSQMSTVLAGVLGLLALLLGFTFSMAATRFDGRKLIIIEEANALGTLALRTKMLPEPERSQTLGLVRRYVDAEVDFYDAGSSVERILEADARMRALQAELWARAVRVAALDPRSVVAGLFIQELNDVIDLHDTRLGAMENHVPKPALWVLVAVAAIGSALMGYTSGLGPKRDRIPVMLATLLVVLVIALIIDLDRPRRGVITVGQSSILRLQRSLSAAPAEDGPGTEDGPR